MLCVDKGVNRIPGPSNGTDQQIAGKGSSVDSTQGNTQGQGTSGLVCVDEVKTECTHKSLGAYCVYMKLSFTLQGICSAGGGA